MKLKRIIVPLKEKAGGVVERIKKMPFEPEPLLKKPGYIDLNRKLATQKAFAALGGVKGATARVRRRIQRIAEDRLKHGLVSQGAVDRLTQREVKKAVQKAETPLKQDINNAASNIVQSIKNTPQTLRTTATKAKNLAKYTYENTGEAVAKTAGMIRENPELAITQGIIAPVSRVGSLALGPGVAAAYNASPVGLGTASYAGMKLLKRPNSVVIENGRPIKKAILRKKRGNEVARSISSRIGNKSIKNSVEGIKNSARSIMEPINPNSVPSYKLMRVTA